MEMIKMRIEKSSCFLLSIGSDALNRIRNYERSWPLKLDGGRRRALVNSVLGTLSV